MTKRKEYSPLTLFLFAILSYSMSALGFFAALNAGEGVPPRDQLVEIAGHLRMDGGFAVRSGRYSTDFHIRQEALPVRFLSKAGPHRAVAEDLRASQGEILALVDHDELAEFRAGRRDSITAFELAIDGITSYPNEQVRAAWVKNDEVGWWLGFGFLVSATLLLFGAWRARQPG